MGLYVFAMMLLEINTHCQNLQQNWNLVFHSELMTEHSASLVFGPARHAGGMPNGEGKVLPSEISSEPPWLIHGNVSKRHLGILKKRTWCKLKGHMDNSGRAHRNSKSRGPGPNDARQDAFEGNGCGLA